MLFSFTQKFYSLVCTAYFMEMFQRPSLSPFFRKILGKRMQRYCLFSILQIYFEKYFAKGGNTVIISEIFFYILLFLLFFPKVTAPQILEMLFQKIFRREKEINILHRIFCQNSTSISRPNLMPASLKLPTKRNPNFSCNFRLKPLGKEITAINE